MIAALCANIELLYNHTSRWVDAVGATELIDSRKGVGCLLQNGDTILFSEDGKILRRDKAVPGFKIVHYDRDSEPTYAVIDTLRNKKSAHRSSEANTPISQFGFTIRFDNGFTADTPTPFAMTFEGDQSSLGLTVTGNKVVFVSSSNFVSYFQTAKCVDGKWSNFSGPAIPVIYQVGPLIGVTGRSELHIVSDSEALWVGNVVAFGSPRDLSGHYQRYSKALGETLEAITWNRRAKTTNTSYLFMVDFVTGFARPVLLLEMEGEKDLPLQNFSQAVAVSPDYGTVYLLGVDCIHKWRLSSLREAAVRSEAVRSRIMR